MHLQEQSKWALEKTGDLSPSRAQPHALHHHLCHSQPRRSHCPALLSKPAPTRSAGKLPRYMREKGVSVLAGFFNSETEPAFELDCKHRWFPWLPKNTYQQLPVTEGQIPVSRTNSGLLLSPLKNGGEEGEGKSKRKKKKILFLLWCTSKQHPPSPPTELPDQSLQVLAVYNTNQWASEPGLSLCTPLLPQLAKPASTVHLLSISTVNLQTTALATLLCTNTSYQAMKVRGQQCVISQGCWAMQYLYSRFVLCMQETSAAPVCSGNCWRLLNLQYRCSLSSRIKAGLIWSSWIQFCNWKGLTSLRLHDCRVRISILKNNLSSSLFFPYSWLGRD